LYAAKIVASIVNAARRRIFLTLRRACLFLGFGLRRSDRDGDGFGIDAFNLVALLD
jgi:hypothetical protein